MPLRLNVNRCIQNWTCSVQCHWGTSRLYSVSSLFILYILVGSDHCWHRDDCMPFRKIDSSEFWDLMI